ncbi:MAG: DUF2721 domain-containing protein [Verrucomicrobiota bacterium]|nr:DUF2721 domain-containing protein [Verrucomicrobiota bacterium]
MEITLATPALLFPALSLLMLAYTNRFLALASRVRNLHSTYKERPDQVIREQIENLRRRIYMIRNMQGVGILSLLFCVICMFLILAGFATLAVIVFGISLLLLLVSLAISFLEIQISTEALDTLLSDLESPGEKPRCMG